MKRRLLRNQDDGSGNGAPPEPQAQGADDGQQSQKYVTADDLKAFGDSMFANMRRMTDQMNQQRTPAPPAARPAKGAPAEPAPIVQDHAQIRQRYDALSDELSDYGFSKEQKARLRSNFDGAAPENIGEWVKGEASLHGVVLRQAQGAAPPQTNGSAVSNPRPSSNAGAPAQAAGMESSDPAWSFPADTVDRMLQQKGMRATGDELYRRLKHDMRGHRFSTELIRK